MLSVKQCVRTRKGINGRRRGSEEISSRVRRLIAYGGSIEVEDESLLQGLVVVSDEVNVNAVLLHAPKKKEQSKLHQPAERTKRKERRIRGAVTKAQERIAVSLFKEGPVAARTFRGQEKWLRAPNTSSFLGS